MVLKLIRHYHIVGIFGGNMFDEIDLINDLAKKFGELVYNPIAM